MNINKFKLNISGAQFTFDDEISDCKPAYVQCDIYVVVFKNGNMCFVAHDNDTIIKFQTCKKVECPTNDELDIDMFGLTLDGEVKEMSFKDNKFLFVPRQYFIGKKILSFKPTDGDYEFKCDDGSSYTSDGEIIK